jgi:hypothetical protein
MTSDLKARLQTDRMYSLLGITSETETAENAPVPEPAADFVRPGLGEASSRYEGGTSHPK